MLEGHEQRHRCCTSPCSPGRGHEPAPSSAALGCHFGWSGLPSGSATALLEAHREVRGQTTAVAFPWAFVFDIKYISKYLS